MFCPFWNSSAVRTNEDGWEPWNFKSRTATRGAVVRDLVSNCEIAGLVPTRLRWCALLKSSKQLSSAPASFGLLTLLINDEFVSE